MKRPPLFALIDCNNFFVSCERLFRPDLEGRPVVVLSSNDGCAVSRSNEAKEIGIPMGAPAFKYRDLFTRHQVVSFSANFELYGNISRRITALLTSVTPRIEVYSVDESFLDISSLSITDYETWAAEIKQLIYNWVGIPVSIGIAPSKTLAKFANLRAKKDPELNGVLSFVSPGGTEIQFNIEKAQQHLKKAAVSDIWGVGWRYTPKLRGEGINTALDLSTISPQRAQQLMGVHGRQLVAELNGMSCHALEIEGKLPKSISVSRTFGQDTRNNEVVEAALVNFATRGAFKLRRSRQMTSRLSLFVSTDKHKPGYTSWNREMAFPQPTADTEYIIKALTSMFRDLYRPEIMYHRAGIILHDFVPDNALQVDLFVSTDIASHQISQQRMQAIDNINNKFGSHKIRYAAEALSQDWTPQRKIRSPRYVSNWEDLPIVRPVKN